MLIIVTFGKMYTNDNPLNVRKLMDSYAVTLVESDTMLNLGKCSVTKLCKAYVNESYITLTRSYVVSMPGLFFLYRKCYVFAGQTEPT